MAAGDAVYDVVQIGYGPVGQASAALLGRAGRSVAVFERHGGLYSLPRAGHADHEVMRIFQSVGSADDMTHDMVRCERYGWRNQHGETLLDIDWSQDGISGWASDYLFYQPYVEQALDAAVRRLPSVEVNHGWHAHAIRERDGLVEVELERGAQADGQYRLSGERRTVRARYVIGADGANSVVRESCGIPLDDLGFREQWLVADFRQRRPLSFAFDNGQICDPARPLCLFQLGKTHRRFEFMVLPGEDPAALAGPDSVWGLVAPWFGPQDADLIRAAVYTFRSANAARWRSGRVFLIGDAAHLMPPFMGQGMCSGVRDAANLAWKLDLVLRGEAGEALLASYETERKPHVATIIDQAVALGRISCTIDPAAAAQRDRALLSGDAPPPPPFPWIERGVLQRASSAAEWVGRLGPQGFVGLGEDARRADDVTGPGWQLITRDDVVAGCSAASREIMRALPVRVLDLSPGGEHRGLDRDGCYAGFFERTGLRVILVRPDFYIFGALREGEALDRMLDDAAHQVGLPGGGRDAVHAA